MAYKDEYPTTCQRIDHDALSWVMILKYSESSDTIFDRDRSLYRTLILLKKAHPHYQSI